MRSSEHIARRPNVRVKRHIRVHSKYDIESNQIKKKKNTNNYSRLEFDLPDGTIRQVSPSARPLE